MVLSWLIPSTWCCNMCGNNLSVLVLFWDTWYLREIHSICQWGWKHLRNVTSSPLIGRSVWNFKAQTFLPGWLLQGPEKHVLGNVVPQLCSHRLKFLCWCSLRFWNDFFSKMIFGKALGTAKDEGSVTQINNWPVPGGAGLQTSMEGGNPGVTVSLAVCLAASR